MRTALCDVLGIEVPVIQAAIGSITSPALTAAVTNAGGMGAIALTGKGHGGAVDRLNRIAQMTDGSICANLILHYDIGAELEAILDHPPKVVSFFWGDITPYVDRVHAAGSLVMANVGSVGEARAAVAAGADIICAQGWEAGGHVRGTMTTMALVPAVVDAIDPVPVVAAGGISDGRGLAAALCLGAGAAWIGTRFLGAEEADIHPDYLHEVIAADGSDTVYGAIFDGGWTGAPGRVLRNETVAAWEAAGCPGAGQKPGEADVIATAEDGRPVHRYDAVAPRGTLTGDIGKGSLWAGQGVGFVKRTEPAAEIVRSLVAEAEAALAL